MTERRENLLSDEVAAAAKSDGTCPMKRGHLMFVGQLRAGKTKTLRALRGKKGNAMDCIMIPRPFNFYDNGQDFVFEDEDYEDELTLSVFDYRGQPMFLSNIQHSYLTRNCCYVVVFDMMKILNEKTRDEAIYYLEFWIKSIEVHATERRVSVINDDKRSNNKDRSMEYPPSHSSRNTF